MNASNRGRKGGGRGEETKTDATSILVLCDRFEKQSILPLQVRSHRRSRSWNRGVSRKDLAFAAEQAVGFVSFYIPPSLLLEPLSLTLSCFGYLFFVRQ